MATIASPFGFAARKHVNGRTCANVYAITNSYATAIGYGDAVLLNTDGTLNLGAAGTVDIIGIFAGVEYTDAAGKPTLSKNWPGAQAGATNIKAYVYDDQEEVYEVQVATGGSGYVQAVIGAQADLVAGTVNAATGQSTMALNATPKAAAAQGQFRIVGFGSDGFYDASTNTFPTVLVQIAQHQYVANKTAI